MRRLALAFLLLLVAGSVRAQPLPTQCPLASRLVHDSFYTVSTADLCYWIVFDFAGPIAVTVPTPNQGTFGSGYTATLVPLSNAATFTLTVLRDPQSGNLGTVNRVNPLSLNPGQSIELRIGAGTNWYGLVATSLSTLSFASPPPIGNVTPNAVSATAITANSAIINGNLSAQSINSGTLSLTGALTSNITGPGPQCVHASSSGVLTGTGTDCGSGGGGGMSTLFVGNTTGPANTYAMPVTVPGAFTLTDQFVVVGTISTTNTSASTLNVNNTGPVALNKQSPSGFTAVSAGDLVAGLEYSFVYNAASGVYIVSNNTSAGTIPAPVNGDVIYGANGIWNATAITSFGYLTGNQTITLTGDTAGAGATAITTTTAKVNGVAYGTSPATNTVPVVTAPLTVTYEAVPNAALANSTININSHSQALGSSLTLAFTDFAGSITAAQMLPLQSGYVYYGNVSNVPVPTPFATLFASPPSLGGSSPAAVEATTVKAHNTVTFTGIAGGGTQCLHVDNAGVVTGTLADCSGAAGSGTVNPGNSNQVAYYPGNASTVGGENTLTIPQTNIAIRAGQTQAIMRSFGAL